MSLNNLWRDYARRIGCLHPSLAEAVPDFMVIGPPKTGTSWMFANLSRHPRIHMATGKELRYFDLHWRSMDINAYVSRFEPGIGRLKGEASPTYCLLPNAAIAAIKHLNPAMKLILLARDPIAQAWSLLKHNFRYREATFHSCQTSFEAVGFRQRLDHFVCDYALSCLDHLGIYQKWRRWFPDRQIWVGTLEEIAADPRGCLESVLAFLELDAGHAPEIQRLNETVNPGLSHPIDDRSAVVLRSLHRRRAQRFAQAVRRHHGKDVARNWDFTWQGEVLSRPLLVSAESVQHFLFDGDLLTWLSRGRRLRAPNHDAATDAGRTIALRAPFQYELAWLRRLHMSMPPLAWPLLGGLSRPWANNLADQRLRAVLDEEAAHLDAAPQP